MFLRESQENGRESHTCSSNSVGFPPKDDDTIGSHHDDKGRVEQVENGVHTHRGSLSDDIAKVQKLAEQYLNRPSKVRAD